LTAFALSDTLHLQTSAHIIGTELVYKSTLRLDTLHAPQNAFLELAVNETLTLSIVNYDSSAHQISWQDQQGAVWVNPGQTITLSRVFGSFGTYALVGTDFMAQHLGASCTILVGMASQHRYIWNLWEMQGPLSAQLATGQATSFPTIYRPNVFTINGLDYPLNMNDTLGNIMNMLGDSIYISVINRGSMPHSLHFHGYHIQIVQSLLSAQMIGWKKDSVPVLVGDVMLFLLIPDQTGVYPVHDHILTANTTAGGYTGGMMTMIEINQ